MFERRPSFMGRVGLQDGGRPKRAGLELLTHKLVHALVADADKALDVALVVANDAVS
jgi:hypothetical protein